MVILMKNSEKIGIGLIMTSIVMGAIMIWNDFKRIPIKKPDPRKPNPEQEGRGR